MSSHRDRLGDLFDSKLETAIVTDLRLRCSKRRVRAAIDFWSWHFSDIPREVENACLRPGSGSCASPPVLLVSPGLEKALRATAQSLSSLRETRPPQRLVRYRFPKHARGTSASDLESRKPR